jgi:hypothetical protein
MTLKYCSGMVLNNGIFTTAPTFTDASHLITDGSHPTASGLGAGTTTVAFTVGSTDSAGQITLTGSVSIVPGKVCTITFSTAFANTPSVVLTEVSTSTVINPVFKAGNVGTSSFDLYVAGVSGVITSLVLNYVVAGAPN